MRRLGVIVGLVCFLSSGVLASNDFRGVGNWADPNIWSAEHVPSGAEEVKVRGEDTVCTLNTSTGDWGAGQRLRVYEGATLIIEEGAELLGAGWMRAGASNAGYVQQIGGLVCLQDGKDSAKLGVGDSGGSDGYYTISGGTLTYAEGSLGDLLVGARAGTGTLTIIGTGPTILMNSMTVGDRAGASGTVEFQVAVDGVSPISIGSASIDELGDETTSALLVSAIDAPPKADIMLVDIIGEGSVNGLFDTVNGNPAPEGAEVVLASNGLKNTYTLTYIGGTGNDIVLVYQSSVTLPTIIWVADNLHYDFAAGLPADYGFVDLLRAQGYKVDYKGEFDPHVEGNDEIPVNPDWLYWRELDPNKIAELNAADLVIVARDPASSKYDDGNEPAEWNSVTTPLIMQSAHIARSNKWGWLNSTGTTRSTEANAVAIDANHPIFDGVAIDPNTQMVEVLSGGWNVDWVSNVTDAGNGTVLATRPDGIVWIAEWEAGQEYFEGSGHVAAGPRMFFASGSGGSNPIGDGTYNLTDDGATMFLNAVNYMLPAIAMPVDPGTDALVAYYAFENDANDSSGNELHGDIVGDPNFVEGAVGMALQLDGVDDCVDLGNDALFDITEAITLAAWVNTKDIGNGEDNPWIVKGDKAYGLKGFRRENVVEFFIYSDVDAYWHWAHADVGEDFNGEWHHAAGTYDGSQLKVYIDGALETVTDFEGTIAINVYNANIGANAEKPGRFYEGAIDEAVIYNRVLSAEEILFLAQ